MVDRLAQGFFQRCLMWLLICPTASAGFGSQTVPKAFPSAVRKSYFNPFLPGQDGDRSPKTFVDNDGTNRRLSKLLTMRRVTR